MVAGIDVSKHWLDVALGAESLRVANEATGVGGLIERLQAMSEELVVMESTGGYETQAASAIAGAGLKLAYNGPKADVWGAMSASHVYCITATRQEQPEESQPFVTYGRFNASSPITRSYDAAALAIASKASQRSSFAMSSASISAPRAWSARRMSGDCLK
jgi:hypothetical protein